MTYINTYPPWMKTTPSPINRWYIPATSCANLKMSFNPQKAGNNGTHICIILDESGSMESNKKTTIKAFNKFISEQKKQGNKLKEKTYVTLHKFNGSYTLKSLYDKKDINEVEKLSDKNYTPNGGTNLLDTLGVNISKINNDLYVKPIEDREKVIVVVLTDGEENCSVYYKNDQIKNMVSLCDDYGWSFMYLGVGLDAFNVSHAYGFNTYNTLHVSSEASSLNKGITSASAMTTRLRLYSGDDISKKYQETQFTTTEREGSK